MKELIDFNKGLVDNVERLDDLIDSYFDDIKDVTETAGDLFKPIKAFQTLYNLNKKRKFKAFLKTYAKEINGNRDYTIKQTERLKDYLKKENNLTFIYDSLENAVNTKSIHCSTLLGYYAGHVLSNQVEIDYKELVIIEALKNMNDIDLKMLIKIYDAINVAKVIRIKDYEDLRPFQFYCERTVEKLKRLQVLEEEESGKYDSTTGYGTFIWTEISEELFDLIEKTGTYELIKFGT